DDLRRAETLEQSPVSVARDDRDHAARRGRRIRDGREQPLLALHRLLVHVRNLDAVDDADACSDLERRARLVGVDVHLQRLGVPSTAASPRRTSAVRNSALVRRSPARSSPSSAISRTTESIVPSTGFRTARYAASLAERKALASKRVSMSSSVASVSAAPRM